MAVVIAKFSNSMDVSSQSIDASQRRDHNEALIAKEGQGGKGERGPGWCVLTVSVSADAHG